MDVILAKPLPKSELYVDYNQKPLNLAGSKQVIVNVGKRTIKNARILISRDGGKSLIRRDWLAKLNCRVAQSKSLVEYNSVNLVNTPEQNK